MFSHILSQAFSWRLVFILSMSLHGLGGRGELTTDFVADCCLDLRVKFSLSLSHSLESEFDFGIPLHLNISIVESTLHTIVSLHNLTVCDH